MGGLLPLICPGHALLDTLAHPKKMTIAMRMAQGVTGGVVPASAVPAPVGRCGRCGAAGEPAGDDCPAPAARRDACGRPETLPRRRPRRLRHAGLVWDVNNDTVRVLAANGCEVLVNRRQGCCGALHGHNGYGKDAKTLARALIDAFSPLMAWMPLWSIRRAAAA